MPSRSVRIGGLVAVGLALAALAATSWVMSDRNPGETDPVTTFERGLTLFVAKGCVVCHEQEQAIARGYQPLTRSGPSLTELPERYPPGAASLKYLRHWLKDPKAVRPNTLMPNVRLDDAEIDALLHFLLTQEHFAQ